VIETDEETENELANCFQKIFTTNLMMIKMLKPTQLASQVNGTMPIWISISILSWKSYSESRGDKSAGPDNIHPMLLKSCATKLAEPFSIVLKNLFATGEIPVNWKTAMITPIYKKGARTDPVNYWPMSLMSFPCRVM